MRYQLARFCEWGKETPDEYQYQINAASLRNARNQGLTVNQLLTLLNRYSKAVPPSLVKALERWDKMGSEARLETVLILKATSPRCCKHCGIHAPAASWESLRTHHDHD